MNVTLSVDDDVLARSRQKAESMGTSVNQLIRDYLAQMSGSGSSGEDATEFERLSHISQGDSRGWKFNRDELHDRR